VRYEFIAQHSAEYPVRRLCGVLGVPPSSYYAWRQRPASDRQEANGRLMEQIRQAHGESRGTYGSPRVHRSLRQRGIICGRHRVARLMRLSGIVARRGPRRRPITTQRRAGAPIWPNRLRQDFRAERPNQKWVADITYIDTREGWLYLAALLDLCSRRVVGWSMGETLKASLVEDALAMAAGRREVGEGLLHHSDRGCQYTSDAYLGRLAALRAHVSMSGAGNCYDNAVMESFFSTLKGECATYRFAARAEARQRIFEFIEVWYNHQRLHSSLGYLSPAEFESRLNSDMISVH
jgi:putative transposase